MLYSSSSLIVLYFLILSFPRLYQLVLSPSKITALENIYGFIITIGSNPDTSMQ